MRANGTYRAVNTSTAVRRSTVARARAIAAAARPSRCQRHRSSPIRRPMR